MKDRYETEGMAVEQRRGEDGGITGGTVQAEALAEPVEEAAQPEAARDRNPSKMDMLHGPLLGKILLFALPLAGGSILQQLFNAVDVAVVGRFASSEALAAVGANTPVVSLFVTLFVGISVGANVIIANYIGQDRFDRISDAVHTAMLFSLLTGVGLMVLGLFVARPLLSLMGTPDNVMSLAILYLRIYMLGMPFILVYNFGAAVLRSIGDTQRPLYCLIVAGVLNAGLNILFVVGLHRSVDGVAAATVLSNVVSSCMVVFFLLREAEPVRLHLRRLKLHRDILSRMLRIGVPAGLQGMVFSFSNVVIQSGINGFGSSAVAGVSVSINCDYITYFAITGFVQAAVTFTAQNYGAGQLGRCRKVFRITLLCSMLIAVLFAVAYVVFRHPLIGLFTKDSSVAAFAERRILIVMIPYFLVPFYEIGGSCLRGLSHSLTPAVLTIIGTCVLRVFWVHVINLIFHDFTVLMLVYPVSWIITGGMVMAAFALILRRTEREFQAAQPGESAA